jgi:hypothetical protein
MRRRSSAYLPLAALLLGAAGCEASTCDVSTESNPPADFRGGALVPTADGAKVYETSAADGQHLNFSAGTQYRIFHQLGARPLLVQPWVSFSPTGVKGGNEAPPAGNMIEILDVNDEFIHVRNDSCGDYWLRVVAAHPVAR